MAITLKAMTYFTTAVRLGNIAQAAETLHIAPSAVATAIDQVEAEFDLTLVTRQRSRGIQANASGRLVARKLERLLEDYRTTLAEGADLKHALSGALRIGYYAPIAPAFLPPILASFLPDDADVTLHLEECDNDSAQAGLLDGTYDVILFVSEGARPAVSFDVLAEAPAYCLVPEGHRFARQDRVTMAELAREPLVVLNRPVAAAYYQRLYESHAQGAKIVAYASSTEMVRSLVGAGHGCAILNMQPQTRVTYSGAGVVGVPIADPLPPLTLSIGYDRTRPRRLVAHFVEKCRAHFAEEGAHRCLVIGD
ncbi:LysR family transcriptional regulator [Gymnodinialimonas ceratoperidinii]|uniref:LysR family transcriptional regulator n=1 Tax=Gymnodinialimonas ceratoperidinii TaxID=2856823 RepID=A0A8F6TUM7_9RHOB|nr:LysR family transcriptional regulator [Gymnodinialimonas ceratoperidinii]QXT38174.1 LysR family transcriptional regulator [Gymnodinialimonas ceratoperidinii]